jgi:drug/metabolite transporter (DMT)-like permease
MAWAFLGEQIAALQLVGMAVVLLALGGIVLGQPKSNKSDID